MGKNIEKQLTENPLLDEIIYECQIMIQGVVLKDEQRANDNETINSIKQSDLYLCAVTGKCTFNMFKYDYKLLRKIPSLTRDECIKYARHNDIIPVSIRPTLLNFAVEKFINNYEEQNNYYRMLYGLPNLGDPGIHLTQDEIELLNVDEFDISKYVHEVDNNEAKILYNCGIIDKLLEKYPDKKYLLHLGERRVEPLIARKAPKFGTLYVPAVDSTEVSNKFTERLEVNRVFFLKTMYSEAYKYRSDYYDRFVMIMIILQSLDDMVVLSPEYIIRRELFDMRTIEYVFNACGVDFFPEIPLKYQKRLVKNLNRLIKFKSCDKNLIDICKLFGFDDIQLFKYYILRIPLLDENGEYKNDVIEDPETGESINDVENNFELQFLKVPFEGNFDDYIQNRLNYEDYKGLVGEDIYWNGVYTEDYVRHTILEHYFNACITKYISVETVYSLTELSFQLIYFINMIMYSKVDTSQVKLLVPEISSTTEFTLVDLLITLYSLMYLYNGIEDNIIYDPVQAMDVKGFNFETDLSVLASYMEEHGYTLEDLGVADFQNPKTIVSFNHLMDVFRTNKNIYTHIIDQMNNANDKKIYDLYKKLYESLYVTKLNFDYFRAASINGKPPKTYKKYLANKNSALYGVIVNCANIVKEEERRLEITKYINYITENIYIYLDRDEFRYIFQNIPTVSLDYVRQYLLKVIYFFKSYKVDLIRTNNIYLFDDKYDNKIMIIDEILFRYVFTKTEKISIDEFQKLLVHITDKETIKVLDKMYMDITWWRQHGFSEYIPVNEVIAGILVNYLYSDKIKTEDIMFEKNHIYYKNLYINFIENTNFMIHKTPKDKYKITDNVIIKKTI